MKKISLIIFFVVLGSALFAQSDDSTSVSGDQVYALVEDMPSWKGCENGSIKQKINGCTTESFLKYMSEHIEYPELAKESEISGTVYVNFIVEKDGSISNVKILRGIGGGCDEEALRVVRSVPNLNPGMQRGNTVRVSINLPIAFKFDKKQEEIEQEITIIEEMPTWKGCESEDADKAKKCSDEYMMMFIYSNLKNPDPSVKGNVSLSFVISKEGNVENVTVQKGLSEKHDQTAIRIVESIPKFIPGTQNGEPVDIVYHIPIAFR